MVTIIDELPYSVDMNIQCQSTRKLLTGPRLSDRVDNYKRDYEWVPEYIRKPYFDIIRNNLIQEMATKKENMELAINKIKSHASAEKFDAMIEHLKDPNLLLFNTIRTKIVQIMSEYMINHGFINPPTYMFSTLTDPLNHETYPAKFSYYGAEHSLNQSLIFHKMAIVSISDINKVFWFSPNIRLESSDNSKKYATEFTQMDFEVLNWDSAVAAHFVRELLERIIRIILPYHSLFTKIVTNLKREAYDYYSELSGEYENFDFEINGIEVCSGAKREYEYDRLVKRMTELNYPLDYFEPILRMAEKKLLKPSAGAGIGIERLTKAIMGLEDIQKIYPFTRRPKEKIVL